MSYNTRFQIVFPDENTWNNVLSGLVSRIVVDTYSNIVDESGYDTITKDDINTYTIYFKGWGSVTGSKAHVLKDLFKNLNILSMHIESSIGVFDICKITQEDKLFGIHTIHALNGHLINNIWIDCTFELWDHKIINLTPDMNPDAILQNAISRDRLYSVQYVVNMYGNSINYDTYLIKAAAAGLLDIVKYLVESGANIHANDDEALIRAFSLLKYNIVEYLVQEGANINARNDAIPKMLQEHDDLCGFMRPALIILGG